MFRDALARVVPRGLRQEIVALRETLVDGWHYQRAATSADSWSMACHRQDRHEARLTMDYHRVEKSLALPEPRRPFGLAVRDRILDLLARRAEADPDRPYVLLAEQALESLEVWNEKGQISDWASPILEQASTRLSAVQARQFFGSRHSVRNFDPSRGITQEELREGVQLAQNTPSVCNRQPFRVHWYRDREQIGAILRIQNGAKGFSHAVPALGVVTARRALFVGPDERNQRWVDGGLFAMTLVWAFHALQLSTCMLNWALPGVSTAALRRVADIASDEDVVVLVAVGHAKEGARVARSEKREIDDLAKFHS